MGELRLYALGIDELRGMVGAGDRTPELREAARRAFAPAEPPRSGVFTPEATVSSVPS